MRERITWHELATIAGLSALSGTAVAAPVFMLTELVGTPWQNALVLSPIILYWVVVVCVAFAVVAALIGAIPILLLRRYMPSASLRTWTIVGVFVGSGIGAFHPFVLLSVVTDYFAGDGLAGPLKLGTLATVCGGVSGVVVGWWYRRRLPNTIGPKAMPDNNALKLSRPG